MTDHKQKLSLYEIITLIISAIGLTSLIFLVIQTRQLSDTLESAALSNISSRQFEMDSVFVEHPEMQPYFFSGVDITEKDEAYARVTAVARARLNYVSTFYEQSAYVQDLQNVNSPFWQAWARYVERIFSASPIMCKQLDASQQDYTPDFVQFARTGCPAK